MRYQAILSETIDLHELVMKNEEMKTALQMLVSSAEVCFRKGGKILLCGNGGSAADAQHLAAELSGRFAFDRPPLPAEALHVNTSYLTAVANDYSFEEVYSRLIEANGQAGDILIAISTSGTSPNIIKALQKAREKGIITVGFSGKGGGEMKSLCDIFLMVPSDCTPRIQEVHILLGHIFCEEIESVMFPR